MFHDHSHHDHHEHGHSDEGGASGWAFAVRLGFCALLLAAAGLAAAAISVPAGEAVVVTRFGAPTRILTEPGLHWRLPAPVEASIPVDLRLRTTSTGLQDVGTRDGLRVLMQAYVAWQVPQDPARIAQFIRAVRNDPDEAARQIRSFVGSALQVTASSLDLRDLVNTDPAAIHLADLERRLREQVAASLLESYGITVQAVGLERLSLPEATLAATVGRMRSERETVAAERTAEGLRAAAQIRSDAARDARITIAHARTEAAEIEAGSRRAAADINARAYTSDPKLYLLLRSLDTLQTIVGANTRLVLMTDAPPFNVLTDGTGGAAPAAAEPASPPGALSAK
ncbi:MAG: protease modulator HflC [Acetobacteraceae bacterium]|nr:protease modulator HflC [Acetobacteraceae bacterium]